MVENVHQLFELSMSRSSHYRARINDDKWQLLREKFNNNIICNSEQRIPKIIHQIWLGSEPPQDIQQCISTVREKNPDYRYYLWDDNSIEDLVFLNKQLLQRTTNLGQKSDIIRYAVLKQFGGVYLDTDFIAVKSFDSLLHLDFFTGIAYDAYPTMFNGLIGCTRDHKFLEQLNNIQEIQTGSGTAVIDSTGPGFMTKKIFDNFYLLDKFVALPVTYFYPYPNFNHDKISGENYNNYITPETICIHLWHSRWN